MEEKTLGIDYYKAELETAIRELHSNGEEIKHLEEEIDSQNQIIRTLREELDRISHEDEIVITTKHKISIISVQFEEV